MHAYRYIQLAALLALKPLLCGYVLLSAQKATLPVTPESPEVQFVWDGNVPSEIKKKEDYAGGVHAALDDHAFMLQLLTDALNIWNEVPGAYVTMTVAEGDGRLDETDEVFSIVVEKSDNFSTAAFARPMVPEDQPELIQDCDISIADSAVEAKSLAFTIAHEIGHCLGLGHPHTNYNSIMGYSRMTRNMALGADDKAGLIYLYPDPAYVDGEPKELVCGVTGVGPQQHHGTALALLLALPLVLIIPTARNRPRRDPI